MPVKVRCPNCERVMNAPEAARGKAVKCPGCQGKVPVPAADAEPAARPASKGASKSGKVAVQKKPADSEEILAGLDFSQAEDTEIRVCPKCGAMIEHDALECPECGVDPRTGQLTLQRKRKMSMKGPDPAEFYSGVWRDAWTFTLANISLVVRSIIYMFVLGAIFGGCLWMSNWCEKLPPKTFWALFASATYLAIPGWFWFLTTEIIRGTMSKKDVLNRVNFDLFMNMALGVKTFTWFMVFLIPSGVIGGILFALVSLVGSPFAGHVVASIVTLAALVFYPIAMCHMAMPVNWRAWLSPLMAKVFMKTAGPVMYWWVVAITSNLVIIIGVGAVTALYWTALSGVAQSMLALNNAEVVQAAIPWGMLSVPIVVSLLSLLAFCFTAVFNMRSMGMLALYFRKELALEVKPYEKGYARKEPKLDNNGKPIEPKAAKAAAGIGGVIAFYAVANIVIYFGSGGKYIFLPRPLAVALNLMNATADVAPAADAAAPANPVGQQPEMQPGMAPGMQPGMAPGMPPQQGVPPQPGGPPQPPTP